MEMYDKKSEELWIESQKILIEEILLRGKFIKENIRINKLALENNNMALKHEKNQLKKYLK